MTALIVISAVLLFILLVLLVPFRLIISATDNVAVYLKIFFFKFRIYPEKPGIKKRRIKKALKKKTLKKEKAKEKEEEPAGIADTLKIIIKVLKKFLEKSVKHLKIRLLRYEIIVSTDDAAKTAILYGTVAQLTSYLLDFLYENADFKVKKNGNINVIADYTAGNTTAKIKIAFIICLLDVIAIALPSAMAFVKAKNENKDKIKADTAGKAEDSCRKTK